ncbi:MAG TPA: c-type cytochrome [Usitatibacter sp.]|nr:c-type cytochrome [Usitatibacter sp.]
MKTSLALAALTMALAAAPVLADEALAAKSGCLACHAVDKKVVGPSYKEVANKYRGDKTAHAKLEKKVKEGGVGAWGQIPMPPNTQVKDEDIKKLVSWVLSLK